MPVNRVQKKKKYLNIFKHALLYLAMIILIKCFKHNYDAY